MGHPWCAVVLAVSGRAVGSGEPGCMKENLRNWVAADMEAAGGKVLAREITVEGNGVPTRPDLLVEDASGARSFVEVKNGPFARLTKNQTAAYPVIQSQGFIPRGGNAAAAGLSPGSRVVRCRCGLCTCRRWRCVRERRCCSGRLLSWGSAGVPGWFSPSTLVMAGWA